MSVVAGNPCDALERPKVVAGAPRGLSAQQIQKLLSVLAKSKVGLRDRAILLTLTFTARRRAEVFGMTAGSIVIEDRVYYRYRGKGGKTGKRELPAPALAAINAWLASTGRSLETMRPEESLWPDTRTGRPISSGVFYMNLQRYLRQAELPLGGVHLFRHTAAKLRRDAGDTVEAVSHFLDHSSLAVTTTYLRRLEGQEDKSWEKVASALGLT